MIGFLLGNWTRIAIYGLVVVMALGTAFGMGYHKGVKRLWDYQAEQAQLAVKIVTKIQKVIEEVLIEHTKVEIRTNTVFVHVKEEVKDVPIRPACNATRGWLYVHDHAATGEDRPDDTAVDDARDPTITDITERKVLEAVTSNYKQYHQVANDLQACRSFVRGIARITAEVPE